MFRLHVRGEQRRSLLLPLPHDVHLRNERYRKSTPSKVVACFSNTKQTYAWIANAIPRPPAKRAAALAFINSFGNAASIWTPFTYFTWSSPYYHPAMGVIVGLTAIAGICGIILRFILERDNKRLARLENESVQLSESDLRKLQKTADLEGIDIATARQLQKGYRFMI